MKVFFGNILIEILSYVLMNNYYNNFRREQLLINLRNSSFPGIICSCNKDASKNN